MKHIYLNLKRFDVPVELGGVNRLAAVTDWAGTIVGKTAEGLAAYDPKEVDFAAFFPEIHLLAAAQKKAETNSPLMIGCQGVYREDVKPGGNFGAFTTNRPAAAMKAASCEMTIIGHCEERNDKMGMLVAAGVPADQARACVNQMLNAEVKCAIAQGMKVLYCIGEKSEEQDAWQEVLGEQLQIGLAGLSAEEKTCVVIAYEPVWSIGPGRTPADAPYITKIARFVKEVTEGLDVVYGGGLKTDNAAMLAGIPEIDGGLIALTRFAGEIGYYPEEYLEIIRLYLGK